MLELLIIGAGPTGLYAGFLAGLRKLNTAIIESSGEAGGQLTAVYKDKFIYDIPGFPKVTAQDYVNEQLKQFEIEEKEKNNDKNNEFIVNMGTAVTSGGSPEGYAKSANGVIRGFFGSMGGGINSNRINDLVDVLLEISEW